MHPYSILELPVWTCPNISNRSQDQQSSQLRVPPFFALLVLVARDTSELIMAPKNKGKGKAKEDEGSSSSAGKLKAAQSINVRHILVS